MLVLPANDNGVHLLVAGHRRIAAARAAELDTVPVIVRSLTDVEILDAMLTENQHRDGLTLAEEIAAVARYQVLAPTESPTKIGKRIGRSVRWVKDRFAVAALPAEVIDRLDTDLTLAQAVALGAIVERGDDDVRECADHLVNHRGYHDRPADSVTSWVARHDAEQQRDEIATKLTDKGVTVFAGHQDIRDANAVKVQGYGGLDLDDGAARKHRHEPCHAEHVAVSYSDRVERVAYCTDPKRHRATKTRAAASEIVADMLTRNAATNNRDVEAEKKNRQARQDRCDAVTVALAKRVPKIDTQRLAALVLIDALDQMGRKQAVKLLGLDTSESDSYHAEDEALVTWLAEHPDPTALLAGLAIGHIESRGTKSSPLTSYGGASDERLGAYTAWLRSNTTIDTEVNATAD